MLHYGLLRVSPHATPTYPPPHLLPDSSLIKEHYCICIFCCISNNYDISFADWLVGTFFFCQQLFSIVVFGCISSGAWYGPQCQMNNDTNACGYGTGVGVLAFLLCIGFLIVDAFFDNLSSVQHRKYAVLADLAVSGELALWHYSCLVGQYIMWLLFWGFFPQVTSIIWRVPSLESHFTSTKAHLLRSFWSTHTHKKKIIVTTEAVHLQLFSAQWYTRMLVKV